MNRKTVNDITNVVQICELVFVFMIFVLVFSSNFEILNVHVFHSTSAWLFWMVQGLLVFRAINPVVKKALGKDKVFIHWVLETVGVLEACLGFSCGYKDKLDKNEDHFITWHGLIGLIGFVLCLFSGLNGVSALYRKELENYISPDFNKYFHIVTGTLGFSFGGASLILSIYSNWYANHTYSSYVSFVLGISLITCIVVWTLTKPIETVKNNWRKLILTKDD